MTRRIFTSLFRLFLRVFFRRLEVVGMEKVPAGVPVIFAVNHPNGLIDPLFIVCFAPRPVSFLAKAPLFRYPIIGWLVKTFDSIPVHRKQDNSTGTHAETFASARAILMRGGSIAIFPEGTTHSDPQLRELKTGAARIALGSSLDELTIVPAGIYYTAKQKFRSAAMAVFGDPIRVEPVPIGDSGEPPRDAVDALTAQIDEGLDRVTLQVETTAALELIAFAEDLFTADEEQMLEDELDLRRRFVAGYHFLRERDPERLTELESKVARMRAELGRRRLEAHTLAPSIELVPLLRALLLFPVWIAGSVLHYPTYRLVRLLAKKIGHETELTATVKALASMALYPLTWIAFAVIAGVAFGWPWSLAALILIPLLGYGALRVFEDLDEIVGVLRAIAHRALRRRGHERLVAQRAEIRDELIAVAEEMGSGEVTPAAIPG